MGNGEKQWDSLLGATSLPCSGSSAAPPTHQDLCRANEQCTVEQGVPVPFQHLTSLFLLSLEQGCRVRLAPLWEPETLELHPAASSVGPSAHSQPAAEETHVAKQTQKEGRNPEFGISPIPATQPPASSTSARDELQPPLLNPTAKTKQAAVSPRGRRQRQESPHVPSKHSQMEGTLRGAQYPLQTWLVGQRLQGPPCTALILSISAGVMQTGWAWLGTCREPEALGLCNVESIPVRTEGKKF